MERAILCVGNDATADSISYVQWLQTGIDVARHTKVHKATVAIGLKQIEWARLWTTRCRNCSRLDTGCGTSWGESTLYCFQLWQIATGNCRKRITMSKSSWTRNDQSVACSCVHLFCSTTGVQLGFIWLCSRATTQSLIQRVCFEISWLAPKWQGIWDVEYGKRECSIWIVIISI